MHRNSQIQLDVTQLQIGQLPCQLLVITLLKPGDLFLPINREVDKPFKERIEPMELETLALPAHLNFNQGIILYGNAPIWLYARLIAQCAQAPWIATYDIRSRATIVVKSATVVPQVGDMISLPQRTLPGMAIAIGGPPDSGKSILSQALRNTLSRFYPNLKVFLHRANWDGEGNWSYETSALYEIPARGRQIIQTLVKRGEYRIHELPDADSLIHSYFQYHAEATKNIRQVVDVAIVDLGGKPQAAKTPVVNQCTHYLIISSQPDEIPKWHELFSCLKPLAVLHSKASPDFQLPINSMFLERTINLSELIHTQQLPNDVMEAIAQALLEIQR